MSWFEWVGIAVMAFVCLWIVLLALVGLRSMFFLATMVWLAILHVLDPRRTRHPPA